MELQFKKTVCPYLRRAACQVRSAEQTQEVRIPDGMPDIGRVIGSWGQALTRGKEWRSNGMTVSGGVMAWVLYLPEDGTEPRVMDAWLPFSLKWDFPETQRDGNICADVAVKSMDARSTSARKLMVRSMLSVLGTAYEPTQAELYRPEGVPEDVQLLKNTYPLELPQECGEKNFQLDEEIPMSGEKMHKLIRCTVRPVISDQKVLGGKLVFKGVCNGDILYMDEAGQLHSRTAQLPFSQFADLDFPHDSYSAAEVTPLLTGMETDKDEEGRLHLKCAIAAQYTVYDRTMVDVVEDAYSPNRKVDLTTQDLLLPARLEQREEVLNFNQSVHSDLQTLLDCTVLSDQPSCTQEGDSTQIRLPMQYQMLYSDANHSLQGTTGRFEEAHRIPSQPENDTLATVKEHRIQAVIQGEGAELNGAVVMNVQTFCEQRIPMVTGMEMGEIEAADPLRPSLVVRRVGENRLWDIAKEYGSTVEAICTANGIEAEPVADKFLLIPVL